MNNENQLQTESTQKPTQVQTPPEKVVTPISQGADISEGFNLMPEISQEEKVVQKAKSTVNIGSVVSLIVLVCIILLVVGFNIISKQLLNSKKGDLYTAENNINQQIDNLVANEEIVDRAILYSNIKKGAFSYKEIVEFLNKISTKVGNIEVRSISISEDLEFSYSGYTSNLEQVSKLWYILGTNENIKHINLESVSKRENNVSFSFAGSLNNNFFTNK